MSWKVVGSGIATMSDSSMALKPVIDEPSKPIPSSSALLDLGGRDREALQVTLEVGEPQEDEVDALLLDSFEDTASLRRIARRPVSRLCHLRHLSSSKNAKSPGRRCPRPRRLKRRCQSTGAGRTVAELRLTAVMAYRPSVQGEGGRQHERAARERSANAEHVADDTERGAAAPLPRRSEDIRHREHRGTNPRVLDVRVEPGRVNGRRERSHDARRPKRCQRHRERRGECEDKQRDDPQRV